MQFARAHKAATYGMMVFSLLAMSIGGSVPTAFWFAGLVGIAISWQVEPRQGSAMPWVWSLFSVLFLAYSVASALATTDFLSVGSQFLIWLMFAKACNRRTMADWQQLHLLSVLMLVAGAVLNQGLSYGVCFIGFVVFATWAFALFHLRREMEANSLLRHGASGAGGGAAMDRVLHSRRIVDVRFFAGTAVVSLVVFATAVVIFLAMPRVGVGFFGKGRSGVSMAGFSERVVLGGHGILKNDSTIIMRVEIDPQHGAPTAKAIHWRGVAFDQYQNGQWFRSNQAPPTRSTLESDSAIKRRVLLYDQPARNTDEITELQRTLVRHKVYLDPIDSNVLFGGGLPQIVTWEGTRWPSVRESNDEIRLPHEGLIVYTVWSSIDSPDPQELRAAQGDLISDYKVYLQLPPEITVRTRELAKSITADQRNNYDKAMAIVSWLKSNLTYTRELADSGKQEAVDYFLFDRKKGHCEYFASAYVVLARAAGVPSRNVNGFLGGEWNGYENYVAVRAGDAHSWAESYFPGVGWVTFDATPGDGGDELGRGGGGLLAKLRRFVDSLRFQWTKWVIDFDLASQLAMFRRLLSGAQAGLRVVTGGVADFVSQWKWIILAAFGLIFVVLVLRTMRTAQSEKPRTRTVTAKKNSISQVYDTLVASIARLGLTRDKAETPAEFAQRVARERPALAEGFFAFTQAYNRAQWNSGDPASASEADLVERARVLQQQITQLAELVANQHNAKT